MLVIASIIERNILKMMIIMETWLIQYDAMLEYITYFGYQPLG